MSLRVFTQVQVYEKPPNPKEKDKSNIHSLEFSGRNIYIGTKDSVVQHLILPSGPGAEPDPNHRTREGRMRKLGSGGPVAQLGAVPMLNHLLVLWDRSLIALNMFSLEPVPSLKRIQHVSLFRVCEPSSPSATRDGEVARVRLVTASARRRRVKIHLLGVDQWECVREVAMPQDPVALAVDDSSVCVATGDRYLIHDYETGSSVDLFAHGLGRQDVLVSNAGEGEFLLNGPGCLGMFVMKTGVCQRPPLQWPEGVVSAGLCFPYVLALQSHALHVYSLLDQQLKQTVSLHGAKGLVPNTDGVCVFTEREVLLLSMVPLEEQIQNLLGSERVEEALVLLDGAQHHLPHQSYQELQKTIACTAGLILFHQQSFTEAKDLFIQGELDPREIIRLFPDLEPLCEPLPSPLAPPTNATDLTALRREDSAAFRRYLGFLADFLRAVRGAEPGRRCPRAVDEALLRLYAERGDGEELDLLVSSVPNACSLDGCAPVLQGHRRFFTLGLLYQSHGDNMNAIQTWVRIADGQDEDSSRSDVYEHVVRTLCQRSSSDVVWAFADWAVRRDQEVGVQIFTNRDPDELDPLREEDVLSFLKTYPVALVRYLEFLVYQQKSEEEKHHSGLALAYISRILQGILGEEATDPLVGETRGRLQQLLWQSSLYDATAVHVALQPTGLHTEKAILLGRAGDHLQALETLVHRGGDVQAAVSYCRRASEGHAREHGEGLFLSLLRIYLSSAHLTGAAADLLNANAAAFDPERVLRMLPESWSLQLVSRFLLGSLRGACHQRRMRGVERGLAQTELLRQKYAWTQVSGGMVRVDKGRTCATCRGDLTEPLFVCSPGGELTHTACTGDKSL